MRGRRRADGPGQGWKGEVARVCGRGRVGGAGGRALSGEGDDGFSSAMCAR
jgi:hypothetical protein